MKKYALIAVSVVLLAVAVGVFVANKDLLFGTEKASETQPGFTTADVANKPTDVTVVPSTNLPVTAVPTTAAKPVPTTAKPTYKNPSFKAESITGAPGASAGTYTGYMPLPAVNFSVNDPSNSRGLSTSVINHSFGVAKNSKPHQIRLFSCLRMCFQSAECSLKQTLQKQ